MALDALDKLRWEEEIKQLKVRVNRQSDQENLIAFYGSSSIRLWSDLSKDLSPHNVINLGFGGSSYYWCDYFFDEIFKGLRPSQTILYAGDNDLGSGTPQTEILQHLRSILNKLKKINSEMIIAVIGIKPSPERHYLRNRIENLNEAIVELMEEIGGHYINIYSKMLDSNDQYRPELFLEDNLHMNEGGYEIWKKEVGDYLSTAG